MVVSLHLEHFTFKAFIFILFLYLWCDPSRSVHPPGGILLIGSWVLCISWPLKRSPTEVYLLWACLAWCVVEIISKWLHLSSGIFGFPRFYLSLILVLVVWSFKKCASTWRHSLDWVLSALRLLAIEKQSNGALSVVSMCGFMCWSLYLMYL